VFVAPHPASAQVNVEKLRRLDEGKDLSAALELDMSVRTGNVETLEVGLGGRMDYEGDVASTLFVGKADLGWQGGRRYSNQGLAHLRQMYRRQSPAQLEVFVQSDYDKSRNLAFRGLLGAGLRTSLFSNDVSQFWWGSAYMFEHERLSLSVGDDHSQRTSVHRWSNYLSCRVKAERTTALAWTVYLQPKLDEPADLRILSEGDVELKLRSSLFLVITGSMRYDSRPAAKTKSLDTAIKSGIAFQF
jgi:hypothetical protein